MEVRVIQTDQKQRLTFDDVQTQLVRAYHMARQAEGPEVVGRIADAWVVEGRTLDGGSSMVTMFAEYDSEDRRCWSSVLAGAAAYQLDWIVHAFFDPICAPEIGYSKSYDICLFSRDGGTEMRCWQLDQLNRLTGKLSIIKWNRFTDKDSDMVLHECSW